MPEHRLLSPIATEPISLVLPAHNAAPLLAQVLSEWKTYLDNLHREYEILLVDDGSTDGTAEQAAEQGKSNPQLRVLGHGQGRRLGYGAALRTGIAAARFPLLATSTCDRQYDPADLGRLLGQMDQVELASGYRLHQQPPRWLRWLNGLYRGFLRLVFGSAPPPSPTWLGWSGFGRRLAARWVFGVRVHDPECAFRLYRRELLSRIPIQANGTFAKVEILAKANFLGAWMTEEPVSYTPPARPEEAVDSSEGDKRGEAYQVFKKPDFGPPLTSTPDSC
jgi:glycosyltransferase involved in cell wall biosynthesis